MKKRSLRLGLIGLCILLAMLPSGSATALQKIDSARPAGTGPTIRIMLKMQDAFHSDGNAYVSALEKRLGVTLQIECPSPSSYAERLNVMMAMGDLPDIVQINWNGDANLFLWAQKGYLKPIDLSRAPNIDANLPKALRSMVTGSDGKLYAVPGITASYPYGVILRADWMDALHLETPHTLNEFVSVMNQFTYRDPDKNGKADTCGVTSWRLNDLGGVFAGAFAVDYLWNSVHVDESGDRQTVKLREYQAGYQNFLDFVKQIYGMGLVDKSFPSLQNAENKFVQGKVGMIGGYSCDTITLEKELQRADPNARLEWILPPCDPEGRVWNFIPESYGYHGIGSMMGENAVFAITKDADYNAALRFLDQMNTRDMILFSNLGIQGVHYQTYDSNRNIVVRTKQQSDLANEELWGISDSYRSESFAYLGTDEDENARAEYYRKKGSLLITNPCAYSMGLVAGVMDFQKANPNAKETERTMSIRYITGAISKEDYRQTVAQEYASAGDGLTSELNDRYQQLVADVPIR